MRIVKNEKILICAVHNWRQSVLRCSPPVQICLTLAIASNYIPTAMRLLKQARLE